MLGEGLDVSVGAEIGQTFVVEGDAGRIGATGQEFLVSGWRALEAAALCKARHCHVGRAAIQGQCWAGNADVTAEIAARLTEVQTIRVALTLGCIGIHENTARLKESQGREWQSEPERHS
jgi:hypothetical protein